MFFMSSFLGLGLIVSFQNCGKAFKPASTDGLSAQCHANIKASAPANKLTSGELHCGDFNLYACERRIFKPDIQDMSHSLKECLPGDSICVDVDVRQYNTSAGRKASGVTDASYAEGGEFNREEVRCYHRMSYRGVALFEGEAATLEESLAKAMAACEQVASL